MARVVALLVVVLVALVVVRVVAAPPVAPPTPLEKALVAVEARLGPVQLESAATQVVAGTNYRLVVRTVDGTGYEAVVWEQLPAYGGRFVLTHVARR